MGADAADSRTGGCGPAAWASLAVALCLSAPGPALAGERPLTLREAEALAAAQSRQVRLAEAAVARAEAAVTGARAKLLPSLSASGSYTRNVEKPVMFLPAAFGGGSAEIGSSNSYQFGLHAGQPLFLGFAGITGYRLAHTQLASARQELQKVRQEVLLELRETYLGAVLARTLAAAQREAVAQAESSLAQVQRRHAVGQVSGFDLLRAQVQLANTRPQLVGAESGQRLADARLALVLGMDGDETPVPVDTLAEFVSRWQDWSLDDLVRLALDRRPDLAVSAAAQQAAAHGVRLARSAYYPTLVLFGTTLWQGQSEHGLPERRPRSTMAGLQLSWSLWDSWGTPAATRQAQVGLRQAEVAAGLTRQAARLEVQAAYEALHAAAANRASQQETVAQALEALRLARVMYDEGSATQLDVLNAQLALTASRTQYASQLHDYHVAHARLEKALGLIGAAGESER